LRSTATHPSATRWPPCGPARERQREIEREREDKDGPCLRVGIRPRPRGDKGGRFFRHPRGGFKILDDTKNRFLVAAAYISRYQKSLLIYGIGYTYQPI
jgi:hypothetical protein